VGSLVYGAPLGGQVSIHTEERVDRKINENWHESTGYVTKKGGRRRHKDINRDLVIT
jgi:hypothetical protein